MGSYFNSIVKNENNCVENRSKYTNKYSRCCYNQDAVVLFRLSNLGAFVFEFTLDAVIIKSAVLFAPIRYLKNILRVHLFSSARQDVEHKFFFLKHRFPK